MIQRFYLESSGKDVNLPRQIRLSRLPATVGRHPDCEIQLSVARLSRMHARIEVHGDVLSVRDLGSTNGTFVNHHRVTSSTRLQVGDVLHFADHEFRLMMEMSANTGRDLRSGEETIVGMPTLPRAFSLQMPAFLELLEKRQVTGHGQLIVTASGKPHALELLGRSSNAKLDEGPGQLFALASALDAEVRLSRMLRRRCFEQASEAGIGLPLFFNNHPAECEDMVDLLDELHELRSQYPALELVFEVHESAVSDLGAMAEVKAELKRLDIALAYDDFGAGQARLLELVEVPPDYLKFDMGLIRDMTERDSPRYRLLDDLNRMIAGMGISTLIEGVEDECTADLCREIGIDYMQGFLFGRPQPLASLDDYHQSEKDSAP